MVNIYRVFVMLLVVLPISLAAQLLVDTLVYENFQGNWPERTLQFYDEDAYGSDSIWINLDIDGAENAQNNPQDWYISLDFASPDSIPASDTNFVAASVSWMNDFTIQNLNWMVLPPVVVGEEDVTTLYWKSAPYQGPRYVDGYKVLLSTTEVDPFFDSYTDTLFVAAEMIPPLPNGSSDPAINALNVDSFNFSMGYVHAERYTLEEYYYLDQPGDNLYVGVLEPHSVSLEDYHGQTVYIAFLHDSFDDNIVSVDDILVVKDIIGATKGPELENIRLMTYPNPVDNYLLVRFWLESPAEVQLELYDMNGKRMLSMNGQGRVVGDQNLQLDLRRLPAGAYNLVLNLDGAKYTRKVVRR